MFIIFLDKLTGMSKFYGILYIHMSTNEQETCIYVFQKTVSECKKNPKILWSQYHWTLSFRMRSVQCVYWIYFICRITWFYLKENVFGLKDSFNIS